jgi:hypothetical protein
MGDGGGAPERKSSAGRARSERESQDRGSARDLLVGSRPSHGARAPPEEPVGNANARAADARPA